MDAAHPPMMKNVIVPVHPPHKANPEPPGSNDLRAEESQNEGSENPIPRVSGWASAVRTEGFIVHQQGQWFTTPRGVLVSLRTRRSISVLLRRLSEERVRAPGVPLPPDVLIAEMWPGQKILRRAARNRLHVAIRTLRTMGLEGVLRFDGTGYFLHPEVPVELVPDAAE